MPQHDEELEMPRPSAERIAEIKQRVAELPICGPIRGEFGQEIDRKVRNVVQNVLEHSAKRESTSEPWDKSVTEYEKANSWKIYPKTEEDEIVEYFLRRPILYSQIKAQPGNHSNYQYEQEIRPPGYYRDTPWFTAYGNAVTSTIQSEPMPQPDQRRPVAATRRSVGQGRTTSRSALTAKKATKKSTTAVTKGKTEETQKRLDDGKD